jgi:hypothetical protein
VYVRAPPVYTDAPIVNPVVMGPREVTVLEFRQGDAPMKYSLRVPQDATPGNIIQVKLGGREFSILLPEYISRDEQIIAIAPAATVTPVAIIPATISSQAPREIKAIEFRDGDEPSKYSYKIPANASFGQIVQVAFAGRDFNIRIPDYVRQGETVIIITPAALI